MPEIKELEKTAEQIEESLDMEQEIVSASKTVIHLSKPFEWCDEVYKKLELDFDGLTGVDMEAIDDEMLAMNLLVGAPLASRRYQRILAARAAHVPSDVIEHLPARDYNAVITATRRFLQATG